MSAEDFQAVVATCFYGEVDTTRAAVPVTRKQKSGPTSQLPSVGGRIAAPGILRITQLRGRFQRLSRDGSRAVRGQGLHIRTRGIRTNWQWRAGRMHQACCRATRLRPVRYSRCCEASEGVRKEIRKDRRIIVQLANSNDVPPRLSVSVDTEKRAQQVSSCYSCAKAANAAFHMEEFLWEPTRTLSRHTVAASFFRPRTTASNAAFRTCPVTSDWTRTLSRGKIRGSSPHPRARIRAGLGNPIDTLLRVEVTANMTRQRMAPSLRATLR